MGLSCFVSTGRSLDTAIARVQLAESLGYEAAYVTHIAGRESLTVVTAYALATERIRVGTGVVPIYTRTPATMAQTAATIADLSGGRVVLGLGVSHRPVVEAWHGQTIDKPLAEMREYLVTTRAILAGEPPPPGEKWPTRFALAGLAPAPELPIYLAALSPGMLKLAGELADGVILWLCNSDYVRDHVIPNLAEGRARVGKTMQGFDVVAAIPSAVVDDPAEAHAAMRSDLLPYLGLPFYRAMLERSGFGEGLASFDRAAADGDVEAMKAASSEQLIGSLTAIGDAGAVRAGIERYRAAGVTSPAVSPVARTDFEAALRAAAVDLVQLAP
ncbi:MAG: LLM class flavin-dependent oxidoreductase [Thermoleophilaceae bacterium]|nr:LLM class flavin-dependent oxidoreductase [Thermoleophilaceae bacterium]